MRPSAPTAPGFGPTHAGAAGPRRYLSDMMWAAKTRKKRSVVPIPASQPHPTPRACCLPREAMATPKTPGKGSIDNIHVAVRPNCRSPRSMPEIVVTPCSWISWSSSSTVGIPHMPGLQSTRVANPQRRPCRLATSRTVHRARIHCRFVFGRSTRAKRTSGTHTVAACMQRASSIQHSTGQEPSIFVGF